MPANDTKRMRDFYSNVFGWQTQQFGEEMGNYVLVQTAEANEQGRPQQGINGGFYPKTAESATAPSIVIGVGNITDHIQKVKAAGGKIIGEPVEIPGVGMWVSFTDTEGNRVSMLQPNSMG